MSVTGFMTHDVAIQTSTGTKNAVNQVIKIWTTTSTVKGLINALSARDIYVSAKRSITADYALYVGPTTVITEQNRVVCDGHTYDVVFVSDPMQMSMFLKCYLRETK